MMKMYFKLLSTKGQYLRAAKVSFLFRRSEDFMGKLNVMSKMTLLSNEDADAEV